MFFLKRKFPNDLTGNALSNLYSFGLNFKIKHTVHFIIHVNDKENGLKVLESMKQKGFEGKLIEKSNRYQIIYPKLMLLEYNEIDNIEKILNKICNPLGGFINGWELKGNETKS